MTVAGWIFLSVAWICITAVLIYCYRLLLGQNQLRGQAEEQAEKPGPFGM